MPGCTAGSCKVPTPAASSSVAQLDQANAYMVLLAPLLPQPAGKQWQAELAQIARVMRARFYDPASTLFVGVIDPKAAKVTCLFDGEDTDFGHTIKAYWMLHLTGRITGDAELEKFARERAPGILRAAYLPLTGSWATQRTCRAKPDDVNRTSTWWIAAELDQAALTFGLSDPALLTDLPKTYDFWLKQMVDHRYGEVWTSCRCPTTRRACPKSISGRTASTPPSTRWSATSRPAPSAPSRSPSTTPSRTARCRQTCGLLLRRPSGLHTETPLPDMPGFCEEKVTFAGVH